MATIIKTLEEIDGMRVACRLGSEVLDYITPFVKPGVTTGELDRLAYEYMVNVQGTIPATLNYAPPGYPPFPGSICASLNDVICHGIPGERVLKSGDALNIDITPITKEGFHGDNSRMYLVGEPASTWATSATQSSSTPKRTATASCASSAATAWAARSTKSRKCCTTAARVRSKSCNPA
jgi:methionine aminopeptidase